jgi:hypothetical protein
LFNADRRRQALNVVDIGLLHHFQKLACISRQRFNVAALPFGIDGIEGEARFTGAGQAGDDRQRVAWNINVHAFEIMLAGTPHLNVCQHGQSVPYLFDSGKCPARGKNRASYHRCTGDMGSTGWVAREALATCPFGRCFGSVPDPLA